MIASADGRAAVGGGTRGLTGPADRALFHGLRAQVDAVMAGAATAAVERYGPLVRDDAVRERRRAEGLEPVPLACLVSGRLRIPDDLPLLQDESSRALVITASEAELTGTAAAVDYLRAPGPPIALKPILGRLRSEHGVRSLLVEGGPAVNRALLEEDLVDELFLTVAPLLVGGDPLPIVAPGGRRPPARLELLWCLRAEDELFLRYRVAR